MIYKKNIKCLHIIDSLIDEGDANIAKEAFTNKWINLSQIIIIINNT